MPARSTWGDGRADGLSGRPGALQRAAEQASGRGGGLEGGVEPGRAMGLAGCSWVRHGSPLGLAWGPGAHVHGRRVVVRCDHADGIAALVLGHQRTQRHALGAGRRGAACRRAPPRQHFVWARRFRRQYNKAVHAPYTVSIGRLDMPRSMPGCGGSMADLISPSAREGAVLRSIADPRRHSCHIVALATKSNAMDRNAMKCYGYTKLLIDEHLLHLNQGWDNRRKKILCFLSGLCCVASSFSIKYLCRTAQSMRPLLTKVDTHFFLQIYFIVPNIYF